MLRSLVLLLVSAACAVAQPTVTAVIDGASFTPGIAPGSIFVIYGTGFAASGNTVAFPPNYPEGLNGVRISLTPAAGGSPVLAQIAGIYTAPTFNQIIALLPSTAAPAAYDLRVENAGVASAPLRVNVVERKPATVTASGDGKGLAQATLDGQLILQRTSAQGRLGDYDTRPARPGERVDLWGTGLGADVLADTGGTSGDLTSRAQIRVIVDGLEVTPAYAGRSGVYPGLDQIAFTLPLTTASNCAVTVQVRAGTALSNPVSLAVATGAACDPFPVVINEVESNGGTPGDWVEFYNTGTAPVDLSGFFFKDDNDGRTFRLPTPTILAPGAYLVIEEAQFDFGLGTPDKARLFRPDGTLAASYSWTPHATTSYGRCPNGTGPLTTTTASTKGAANACPAP